MTESDITKRPEESEGDVAHTAAKALISAIPYFGGPAAEIFGAVIVPPIARRRDKWIESIAAELIELQRKVQGFTIAALAEDDVFITTLIQASEAAIRNHQAEKLQALRNAVLNAAIRNAPEEDIQLMFLNFIDSLTQWHMRVLRFLDDPKAWAKANGITYPHWTMGAPSSALEHAFKELAGKRDFYDLVVKDLHSRGLTDIDSLHTTMTLEGMLSRRTSSLGKQFIAFITSPTH